ncbi:hypothetical protein BHE90_007883 [Fusarium euwallaceae]|uniref:DUF6536 domain-containing protein n=1 Tax=Fusarium euwallaceae TaxID=1147111 RepID=A0A430LPM4_9HYPO|nr:hypothetical protein BHE90_007883 [Fusarium euwallaceae]
MATRCVSDAAQFNRRFRFESGWRFGLFAGAASCAVVFIINLFTTIWAMKRDKKNKIGQPVLQEGPCSDMRYLNTGLHLVINALSSVMLAASNYGMQCISAPTRADVDKAHFEGKWMDIGVPSVHNLWRLPTKRVALWGLLMVSSLPLHLLYNSVIFSSLGTVNYQVWQVLATDYDLGQSEFFDRTSNGLKRLENLECIRQYATSFQTSHQDVILVTAYEPDDTPTTSNAMLSDTVTLGGSEVKFVYHWVCGSYPTKNGKLCHDELPALEKDAHDWRPRGYKVNYCYSQPIEGKCQLTFSLTFITFVLVSNALKAAILLYIARNPPDGSLFVLGDAVESFLTTPDAFSGDSCLASVSDIRKDDKNWARPRPWAPIRRRWAGAISRRRWKVSIFLYLIALMVAIFLLVYGIVQLPGSKNLGVLWRIGFGAVTELTLINAQGTDVSTSFNMTESVLLANLPHFVFSGLYFQYNALFTGMLAANEWSDFGRKRKGLRVSSDPRGEQRSRYFLQLPYRWSIPLILMSMLIHWMLSQSIFLAVINFGDDGFATTCGYSPIAILAVVITAVVMAIPVVITGYRRLPTAMPVVGSCSLGIAAACHGLGGAERSDEPLVPLRWGAMSHPNESSESVNPGHSKEDTEAALIEENSGAKLEDCNQRAECRCFS